MLFLVALRDVITDDGLKQFIESKYLRNDNVSDDSEYKIKLKQVETDWKVYCDIILGNHLPEKSKNSAVYRNYIYLKNELGLSKFSVVTVELQPDRNPWYEHWNRETIEKRSKWIINYLLQVVLPIPDDMRKTNNFVMKMNGLSFLDLQLIGQTIDYASDNSIHAKVVSDKEVEFEGKRWHLSPLKREIETRKGTVNASGAYKGSQHWEYDGIKLIDII